MKFSILLGGIFLAAMASTAGATPFVNLDFEQANITTIGGAPMYPSVYANEAFPGWLTDGGNSPTATVNYDNIGIGGALIAFYDKADPIYGIALLQGKYDGVLVGDNGGPSHAVTLSQTGEFLADAMSLTFLSSGDAPPVVTINDIPIPLLTLSTTDGFSTPVIEYGGVVSAFAGTTSELKFASNLAGITTIDAINFSADPLPEPCGLMLVLSSAIPLLSRRRRKMH